MTKRPHLSVAEVLEEGLRRDPSRLALVDDRHRLSFAALDEAVRRAAAAFYGLGVREGDRVAAALPNSAELVIAFLASQRLGAIWVGMHTSLAPREKAFMLNNAGVSVYLAGPAQMSELAEVEVSTLKYVLEASDTGSWTDLCARSSPSTHKGFIDPHAPSAIAYTSGTTGFPKGAVHSQHNLMLMGHVARASGFYEPSWPHGVMLPLTTLNLMVLVPLLTLQNGAPCIVLESHKPAYLRRRIREEAIAHLTAVPAIYHDLFADPEGKLEDLRSLIQPEMGGANIPPAIREKYRAFFGQEICVGYGMTEAPATVTRTRKDAIFSPGLCGHPLPQYEIEIRAEDGGLRPLGEVGEICVRAATKGPFAGCYEPMLGYWKNPEATREVLCEGRYHTGDLGYLDEHGQLFVMGRKKEMIVRGGANVYPAEVERVLHQVPGVAAAAVIGVADARLGERIHAFITMDEGAHFDEVTLRSACERELARYKVPEVFHQRECMPRNAMGKILKSALAPR